MEKLSKYTPAETLVLLYGYEAPLKDILRVTFLDLLLKKVLQVIQIERQPHPNERPRIYEYVTTGQNYYTYQQLPHEKIITAVFDSDKDLRLFFRFLVKEILSNIKSRDRLITRIVSCSEVLKFSFKINLLKQFLNLATITNKGEQERDEIYKLLAKLNNELPELLENNKKKALETLKIVGGNVFLLRNVQFDRFNFPEFRNEEFYLDLDFLTDADFFLDADDFSDFFDSIDSWIDSFDLGFTAEASIADGGSGCSSGCGGDSGCSGCGSCGGD